MGYIGLSYNFSSVAQDVIGVVYAHTNPSAEIAEMRWVMDNSDGKPKVGKHTVLNTKPGLFYTIKFYASSDGSTLETDLDCDVMADGARQTLVLLDIYEYVVGGGRSETNPETDEVIWADPEPEDEELHDKRLIGVTTGAALVQLQGYGPFLSFQITWLETGGFSFVDGKKFYDEEKYVIWKKEVVTVDAPPAEVVSELTLRPLTDEDFTDGVINFSSDLYNKRCPIIFTGQFCKLVVPDFALVADNIFEINTYQGNQIYFQVQFSSGNTVALGGNRNVLDFPKMERCRFEWKAGVCYITEYNGRMHMRGQIIGDSQDRSISNAGPYLSCAETGSPLDGTVFSGLYNWLLSLPNGYTVSMTDWPTNKRKWALDTITKTFRPPMVLNMHRRFRSDSEAPGDFIDDQVKEHDHHSIVDDFVNAGSSPISGTKSPLKSNELNNNTSYRLQGKDAVPTLGPTSKTGGLENTVKAYKEIPLVVL